MNMIIDYIFDIDEKYICRDLTESVDVSEFLSPHFYDTNSFHLYHQRFADKVVRLFIKSNSKVIGYCYLGFKDNQVKAPYSSPFSLIYLKKSYKVSDACSFIMGVVEFCKINNFDKVLLTLPPEIYGPELISTLSCSAFTNGFKVKSIEINNYFDFKNYIDLETYLKCSVHKVRKNYKRAVENGLEFIQLDMSDIDIAYDVIKINREQMGYPLKISKQQMQSLINMDTLTARAFVVMSKENPIAAAIIFDVTDDISQVVYWGDVPDYRNERAMDLLTAQIFSTYKELGKKYLDIGPSSEDGIINIGLADFKKSIGCSTNTKLVLSYSLE